MTVCPKCGFVEPVTGAKPLTNFMNRYVTPLGEVSVINSNEKQIISKNKVWVKEDVWKEMTPEQKAALPKITDQGPVASPAPVVQNIAPVINLQSPSIVKAS